jgi:uncharacterized protein with beta-barrel porin domain
MRNLLACTCLTPIAMIAMAGAASAETSVATKVTSPVRTSTVKAGARDDILIGTAGSVVPVGGAAVTIDTDNNVKNDGAIQVGDANDSTGILTNAGTSGTIANTGKIELLEAFTPTDTDNDGDMDGAFASGARRVGIRTAGGFTGTILNSGTISIEANDSAGISLGGKLTGSLNSSGTISVTGNNAYGIRAGDVTGDVKVSGTTSVLGKDSVAVAIDGNIGGAVVIQGGVASTGYRYGAPPADVSKLDGDDLLQGGPALRISGNVAKGILLDVRPADNSTTDTDEDDDGIEDSKEGNAAVVSLGAAPAIQIGAADHSVDVGAVAGNANGHGLVIKGEVAGRGVYAGVNGTAIQIGGMGGAVTIAGGATVSGAVGATSNGASATAFRVGSGATVNELRVGGAIEAAGGKSATSLVHGVLIDAGGTVTAIRNSGRISATASEAGTAGAIVDNGGKLALVENSGTIKATGVAADSGRAIAIDLHNNALGATVKQVAAASGAPAPSIIGDIRFGGGDDTLDVAAGDVSGKASFGAGADKLLLSGNARFTGTADFGGGADVLALSGTARFTGTLANSGGLAVQVNGGTLQLGNSGTVQLGSLSVGGAGTIGVTIDGAGGKTTLYQVAGAASFAQGSKLQVNLADVSHSEGTFTVLKAGTLTGTAGLSATNVVLPVFFKSSLSANEAAGQIAVVVSRKSTTELGLNRSQARAWDSVFQALDKDSKVAGSFLAMTDTAALQAAIGEMLPEHAGGTFEMVTQGSRASARFMRDPSSPYADMGGWGIWLQQVAWGTSKDIGNTASYDISGWGAAGGAEVELGGMGNAGLSVAYLGGRDGDGDNDNEVRADQYELAAYWRGQWGHLRAHALASAAMVGFDGRRVFTGTIGSEPVTRTSNGKWDGKLYSAAAGLSYELELGRLVLRPGASVDYYRLNEDGYSETGGGNAMDLTVGKRTGDELAGEATLTAGYRFGSLDMKRGWFRAELEGGRRQILGGAVGETIARFGTGTPFTLLPEARSDGWLGRLRLLGGGEGFTVGSEFSAEQQQGRSAIAFRVGLNFSL